MDYPERLVGRKDEHLLPELSSHIARSKGWATTDSSSECQNKPEISSEYLENIRELEQSWKQISFKFQYHLKVEDQQFVAAINLHTKELLSLHEGIEDLVKLHGEKIDSLTTQLQLLRRTARGLHLHKSLYNDHVSVCTDMAEKPTNTLRRFEGKGRQELLLMRSLSLPESGSPSYTDLLRERAMHEIHDEFGIRPSNLPANSCINVYLRFVLVLLVAMVSAIIKFAKAILRL